jgi:hypothetical protein
MPGLNPPQILLICLWKTWSSPLIKSFCHFRLLSYKLSQREQARIEQEKAVKEAEERALEEKKAMAAKKVAKWPKSVIFITDISDSDSDGYLSSDVEGDHRRSSGTKQNVPTNGFLPQQSGGFSHGLPWISSDAVGRFASSAQCTSKKYIDREASILKRELSANPALKRISLKPDTNLNEYTDGAMNLATRRLEKTRRLSMAPLVGHLPYRDKVEMLQIIQSRRRKSAPSRVSRAGKQGFVKSDRNFMFRPQTVASCDAPDTGITRRRKVSISTLNPGNQKVYIPRILKEKNSSGDSQERQKFLKLRKQQEIRMYNDILKRVDSFILGTSAPRKKLVCK